MPNRRLLRSRGKTCRRDAASGPRGIGTRRRRLLVEVLEPRRLLAGDIQLRFEFVDLSTEPDPGGSRPALESVHVGDEFQVHVYIRDSRDQPTGIDQFYFDFVYNHPSVISAGQPARHGDSYGDETSGDGTQFPRVEDLGGARPTADPPASPGGEFPLVSLTLKARAAGSFSVGGQAGDGAGYEILFVGSSTPVPWDDVLVTGTTFLEVLPTVEFAAATSSVLESAGIHSIAVTLNTGGTALGEAITVDVVPLVSSTAVLPDDVDLVTNQVTFPAGSNDGATQAVQLTIPDDGLVENNEQLYLRLDIADDSASSSGVGYLDHHQVTIIDDEEDRVEFQVFLYADHNGLPGVIITDDAVDQHESFFAEIVVGDYRPQATGVIGLRMDFDWPDGVLEILSEFPIGPLNPLVTDKFPLVRGGTLETSPNQQIKNLVGGSNPAGGRGSAIGLNAPERFSLIHFVPRQAATGSLPLDVNVDVARITLADNTPVTDPVVESPTFSVNRRPVANNDSTTLDRDTSDNAIDVLGNDFDPDSPTTLTITSVSCSMTEGSTCEIVGTPGSPDHQIRYTPPPGFIGSDLLYYTINDGNQLGNATAQVTVEVANWSPASLSGFVYLDSVNPNGIRDSGETGIPGIMITLNGATGQSEIHLEAMTADDGSYGFVDLPPGTYELVQHHSAAFIDGTDSLGSCGGSAENDRFFDIPVASGQVCTEYDFGERGYGPDFISKQLYLASTPSPAITLRERVARAAELAGDSAAAQCIRDACIPSVVNGPGAPATTAVVQLASLGGEGEFETDVAGHGEAESACRPEPPRVVQGATAASNDVRTRAVDQVMTRYATVLRAQDVVPDKQLRLVPEEHASSSDSGSPVFIGPLLPPNKAGQPNAAAPVASAVVETAEGESSVRPAADLSGGMRSAVDTAVSDDVVPLRTGWLPRIRLRSS